MEVTSILKSPWNSVTQRVWVYLEKFNIDFLPEIFFLTSPSFGTKTQCKIFRGGTLRGGHF